MVMGCEVFQTPNPDDGILKALIHWRGDFHCAHQESSHIFTFRVAAPLMNFSPRVCCGFYAEVRVHGCRSEGLSNVGRWLVCCGVSAIPM